MALRLQGLALFLFIPLVLFLFLNQPFGVAGLIAGIIIMLGHRFIAGPWVERTLGVRCIWSGAEIAPGCVYKIDASGKIWPFNSYSEALRDRGGRFFTFAQKFYWPLRVAILGPVVFFLVMELLRHFGMEVTSFHTNSMVFRGVIGLTTLTTFIAYRFIEPIPHMKGPVKFPFPAHNLALLGVRWTLVVFGVVGAVWVYRVAMELI